MYKLDYKEYAEVARELCASSCVMLKNDKVLPIKEQEVISVFGRVQIETYSSGTGSGGMVNYPYVVSIIEGLQAKRAINEELLKRYIAFIEENPFDKGQGWAHEPWSQIDMELTEEIVKEARSKSDVGIYTIGRSAGEDNDSRATKGSYYLTDVEVHNMKLICKYFEKSVIMLNVGNIIDMSELMSCNPGAIIYTWHGGSESGNGYADVLCGDVNPSACLSDTIPYKLEDNPVMNNFGGESENIYQEDIYVGYRYFETFAREKVLFPFGFGLSYTQFSLSDTKVEKVKDSYVIRTEVQNTGQVSGKKVVQVYVQAPNGVLGKASKVLVGFAKTKELEPKETEIVTISVCEKDFASYDDHGKYKSSFVLEAGKYQFHIGFDVRNIQATVEVCYAEDKVVEYCIEALVANQQFERMIAVEKEGTITESRQLTPKRTYDLAQRIREERQEVALQTSENRTFFDIQAGKISVEEFVNDLSDQELIYLTRGEGMCSPKVTSGTASAFGGVTDSLLERKIPIACCADGPSGIRMDSGTMAFSLPNGTAIASTFDQELTTKLFEYLALELVKNKIDTILGPGLNIHRSPLCGRNFEYFSEDPFLSGKMTIAELQGLHKYGVTGTIKHFACNSQETGRHYVNAIVSERALREIYLKGFEMAVKEGEAFSIMTAYNPVNGIQSASNFDLTTTILRKDWKYEGIVMSDWWARMNVEGGASSTKDTTSMIIAQNDIYMVSSDSQNNGQDDNSESNLEQGALKRFELLRMGKNIMSNLLKLNCAKEEKEVWAINVPEHLAKKVKYIGEFDITDEIPVEEMEFEKGMTNKLTFNVGEKGHYKFVFALESKAVELAQIPMSVFVNGTLLRTITLKGTTSCVVEEVEFEVFVSLNVYLDIYFGETGMTVKEFHVEKMKS